MGDSKTVIVTGASQGIGAAVAQMFLDRSYNVLATSRKMAKAGFAPSAHLVTVDGDIGEAATAEEITRAAVTNFGSIDHVVHCAGIFFGKPFPEYSAEDLERFLAINVRGFVLLTQLVVKQMLTQGTGGSVTTITAALADNPVAGHPASVPMMTKGALDAITLSLASEYAKDHIRFNAVAPGVVDTPLQKGVSKQALDDRTPMGTLSQPKDIAEAVLYLAEAVHVTGEVLHVDDGAHVGRW